jgi:hypothetical protein
MAIPTILMTTSSRAFRTSSIGLARSGLSWVSAAPNIRPKKITPSMSPSAADLTGLRVTMLTNVSIPNPPVCCAVTLVDASAA